MAERDISVLRTANKGSPERPSPRRAYVVWPGLESPLLDRQSQPVSANEFVVGAARLRVLTDDVNVLEGALEEMPIVDRGRTGGVVDSVDHLYC